ncbi:hypothetical protein D3C84_1032040 [compost metagenome]
MNVMDWYIYQITLPTTWTEMMGGSSVSFSSERATSAKPLLRLMGMVSTGLDTVEAE